MRVVMKEGDGDHVSGPLEQPGKENAMKKRIPLSFTVNGEEVDLYISPSRTLLEVLREELDRGHLKPGDGTTHDIWRYLREGSQRNTLNLYRYITSELLDIKQTIGSFEPPRSLPTCLIYNVGDTQITLDQWQQAWQTLNLATEKVQAAKALEESYLAERDAELGRAAREKATQEANVLVEARIQKQKVEIDAEAIAERTRREARGEADAIFFRMKAQADGINEILTKQAAGFTDIVRAAGGNSKSAVSLMIADKLETIVASQVEAIKGIKIDKVTVWDNMGGGGDGKPATAKFMSGMLSSLPPLEDVFNMAGMNLPDLLSVKAKDEKVVAPKKVTPKKLTTKE